MPEFLLLIGQNKKQKRLKCKRPVSKGQPGKKPQCVCGDQRTKEEEAGQSQDGGGIGQLRERGR